MSSTTCNDYDAILAGNYLLLDVRAPVEYARGALTNSVNQPILNDEERAKVGTAYKQRGHEVAKDLGFQLVSDEVRENRIQAWLEQVASHPNSLIMCWRGGLRSQITQTWLADRGCKLNRVEGGFKALRQRCMALFEEQECRKWLIVAGPTGVGKTQFINQYESAIDLENLAKHRGSSFGRLLTPQPNPIGFEFALAQELLKSRYHSTVLLEDESRMIGRLSIPSAFFQVMQQSPICVLEATMEERVQLTFECYVDGVEQSTLLSSLDRIQKRLGGVNHKEIARLMKDAFCHSDEALHKRWIQRLLETYYDPMYQYQLSKKTDRVEFVGNKESLKEHLRAQYSMSVPAKEKQELRQNSSST